MKPAEGDETSSEFELSLDIADDAGKPAAKSAEDSDSEFELTLDDSSEVHMEIDSPSKSDSEETQDIFESDFEIPALSDEGAEEPATVDTETESSDFDLALDDSELAADEESGSQVVALDEEEVEPVAEESEVTAPEEEGEFADLEEEAELEEDETRPARVEVRERLLRPAPWGPVPAIVMFLCVPIMMLSGMVGYEMVQSSVAQRPPGLMTRTLNDGVLAPIGFTKPFQK
jgi:hypothetical protein